MAQYFFDVTNGESTFKDAAGATFSSLEDARAHAVLFAGELAADGHHYVGFDDYRGFLIRVVDEEGNGVAQVPVVTSISDVTC